MATLKGAIPRRGDRIEISERGFGVGVRGTVFHSDEEQILVDFDSGATGRVVPGRDAYRILAAE